MDPHHIKSLEEDPRFREEEESSQKEDAFVSDSGPSKLVVPADLTKEADELVKKMEAPVFVSVSQNGRIRRNGPCPCGSGKKFKACHLSGLYRKQAHGFPPLTVTGRGIDAGKPISHVGYQPPKSVRKALIKAMKEAQENGRLLQEGPQESEEADPQGGQQEVS